MKVSIDAKHLAELQYAAREYVDGRMTYLTQSVNDATAVLLDAGVKLHTRHGQPSVWATDGNFGPPHDLIEKYGIDGKKARTA
jgi:hypothetical protein